MLTKSYKHAYCLLVIIFKIYFTIVNMNEFKIY